MISGNDIGENGRICKCLIHLDRLSITFKHWSGSTFLDIRNPDYVPNEQIYNTITLIHDNSPGLGAFYHSYIVLYKGIVAGRLHSATKLKKHEIQFDFAKQLFYSFYPDFWFEVYDAVRRELGVIYNNIMYVEIAVDTNKDLVGQFAFYYQNSINNHLRTGDRYKLKRNTIVNVMNNGASFVVAGTDNEISLYNKSKHAESFILDYFSNNGLKEAEVYRIESRLHWNYIRYLRNKKRLDINAETLKDSKKLAKIFELSTRNKTTFLDKNTLSYDKNRNLQFSKVNLLSDLPIETAEIGKLNPELRKSHYISDSVDENIIRQIYYRYLETGNKKYFRNFRSIAGIASINERELVNIVTKFNERYKGNRTDSIIQRMVFATKKSSKKYAFQLNEMLYSLAFKMKWNIMGLL